MFFILTPSLKATWSEFLKQGYCKLLKLSICHEDKLVSSWHAMLHYVGWYGQRLTQWSYSPGLQGNNSPKSRANAHSCLRRISSKCKGKQTAERIICSLKTRSSFGIQTKSVTSTHWCVWLGKMAHTEKSWKEPLGSAQSVFLLKQCSNTV